MILTILNYEMNTIKPKKTITRLSGNGLCKPIILLLGKIRFNPFPKVLS